MVRAKTLTAPNPILDAMQPRISRGLVACDIRTLRRRAHEIRDRYRGGMTAEIQSRHKLLEDQGLYTPDGGRYTRTSADGSHYFIRAGRHKRPAIRRAILSRRGRKIELAGLLNQSRADGSPAWAIVDPRSRISSGNGGYHEARGGRKPYVCVAGVSVGILGLRDRNRDYEPVGMPPIPQRVRDLIEGLDPKLVRWAGVLYQPESWIERDPDPALIVEYQDVPCEYFALAVWGGDRAQIMEWVD